MISRGDPTDGEWALLEPLLPTSNNRCGRWRDHRQVIDGIIHRLGTGVQWRELPERFGCAARHAWSRSTGHSGVRPTQTGGVGATAVEVVDVLHGHLEPCRHPPGTTTLPRRPRPLAQGGPCPPPQAGRLGRLGL
ncbi:transposase [Streptomyces sp. NPDC000941]